MIIEKSLKPIITKDGVRTIIGMKTNNSNTPHMCGVFIHRYDCAVILGLVKRIDNSIEWKRMLAHFNKSLVYLEDPNEAGITYDNISSTKSTNGKISKYELQLPEYINSEIIEYMAFSLRNPIAIEFKRNIVNEVIPFYQRNASPEQIANVPILNTIDNVQRTANPGIFYGSMYSIRKNQIRIMLNQFEQIMSQATQNHIDDSIVIPMVIEELNKLTTSKYNTPIQAFVVAMKLEYGIDPSLIKIDVESIFDAVFNNDMLYMETINIINRMTEKFLTDLYAVYNENMLKHATGNIVIYAGGLREDSIEDSKYIEITGNPDNEIEIFGNVYKESDVIRDLIECYADLKFSMKYYGNNTKTMMHYYTKSKLFGRTIKLNEPEIHINILNSDNVVTFESYPKYQNPSLCNNQ